MLEAVIFDMDGLLVNTEPFWVEAEIRGFAEVGLNLSHEDCKKTMGYRVDEVVGYWHKIKPWEGFSVLDVVDKILLHLQEMIEEKGGAMEGVDYILDFFAQKGLKIGLASSSHIKVIHQVVDKLNIRGVFEVLHSAEFEDYGKPHPAVFLSAAHKLNCDPLKTLAFEDSFNGLLAAKSARMKTVAVPDISVWHETQFDIADFKLKSLSDFNQAMFNQLMF